MQALLGIIFHVLGGFASGSFYLPYKKVKHWQWETYWLAGGIFSWLIAPVVATLITVPNFYTIIIKTSTTTIFYTYLMGVLWGIGGLTFGLSMRYLGMSLGMSIALGFCSAFGALIPSVFYNFYPQPDKISFTQLITTNAGILVLMSVIVCLIGIAVCGRAGMLKEKELNEEQKQQAVKEFNLLKGLLVAVISGILSACFSFGIETGKPMAETAKLLAENKGKTTLFVNNVVFVVILLGGLTTNFIWCLILSIKKQSYKDYYNKSNQLFKNYILSALAGITWFLQFFFYGMGETKLGNGASSWILHMASIIIVSNLWGIKLKEWQNTSKKTFNTLIAGVLIILLSVILCGIAKAI
jgi:L-rhamnose-H+ transport protein